MDISRRAGAGQYVSLWSPLASSSHREPSFEKGKEISALKQHQKELCREWCRLTSSPVFLVALLYALGRSDADDRWSPYPLMQHNFNVPRHGSVNSHHDMFCGWEEAVASHDRKKVAEIADTQS